MSRAFVLLLLTLSVGLTGATTCHYSSGGGKEREDDDRGDGGIEVIVDTRTSTRTTPAETGGTAASEPAAIITAALGVNVTPLLALETSEADLPDTLRHDVEELDGGFAAGAPAAETGVVTGVPEPGAAVGFATGCLILAWQLRRLRR